MTKASMKKFADYILPGFILASIVLLCFHRTLGSYFIADDFGQVAYASGICKGNLNALLANFTGNYMQIPVMKIYRPGLLLSFMFDYALWHTKAFGYFLTNILSLIAASAMLYYLLREVTRSWNNNRSMLFSFLSAALFASNPLHCESISFVSGRDNVISAFFYLLSFWCFVRKKGISNRKLSAAGIISFCLALLCKETAVGLPVVLSSLCFFLPELFQSKASSLKERLRLTTKESAPFWITVVIYLLVRFLALGTFTGGYTGDIGAGLMANMAQRWSDCATIFRIIFPLNFGVFGPVGYYYWGILATLYAVLITLIAVRFLNGHWLKRMLGFFTLWILTTIAPLYQLWGLGENLEGARFFFFLSMPLSIILPLLILAPAKKSDYIEGRNVVILGVVATIALILLDINITYNNNIAWVHAGKQTRACLQQSQALARLIVPGKKVALLGLPKEQNGAHVIYNGSTFNVMMSPPFSTENYAEKFITFDPLFYGLPELINTQRLKTVLCDTNVVGLDVWNENTLTYNRLITPSKQLLSDRQLFAPVIFQPTNMFIAPITSNPGTVNHIVHQICINDSQLLTAPANVNPYQYDFLELTLITEAPKELLSVFWKSSDSLGHCDAKHPVQMLISRTISPETIRIRLSNRWHWFTQGNINRLQLEFMPGYFVKILNMRLVSGKGLTPAITIANSQPNTMGVYVIEKDGLKLDYDATAINHCASVKIEFSKPNYFFEGLSPQQDKDSVMKTIIEAANKGHLLITNKLFQASAYYQVRAVCLDKAGKPIGEKSDPLTVEAFTGQVQ